MAMKAKTKGCWGIAASCFYATVGGYCNGWITVWLLDLHHFDMKQVNSYIPRNSMLLGFFLSYVTSALMWESAKTVRYTVFALLGLTVAFFIIDLKDGKSWLVCLDQYGFSFLWALSLIAIGYILRSRPKNRMN